jgi:peptidoglycan-associated lipoprotein
VFVCLTACSTAPANKEDARSSRVRIEQPRATPSPPNPVAPPPPASGATTREAPTPAGPEQPEEPFAERNIYFPLGDAKLSPNSLRKLQRHAQFMKQNPKRRVTLIGYSEGFGSRNYTLAIMEEHLAAVSAQLQEFGVEKSRIRQIIFGGKGSQKSCEGSTCRQRVEIRFH